MKTFHFDIPIRFGHVDAAGIVFYPRFVEMLNRVIEEWFGQRLGCNFSELHFDRRLGIPTARLEIDFLAPCRLDETIRFELVLKELRNSAFVLEHRVTHRAELRMRVYQRLVCVSLDDIRAVPVPADIRQRMLDYLYDEPAASGE